MKITFHIVQSANEIDAWRFACKIIEQQYHLEKKIYIYTESVNEANRLDHLLWIYDDSSFLPHALCTEPNQSSPIVIGYDDFSPSPADVLINLSTIIPSCFDQFNQINEIVFSTPAMQQLARERYRQYRAKGFTIDTHKI